MLARHRGSIVLTLVLVLSGVACSSPTYYACTADVVPAIVVTIRDSVSGNPLASLATATAREGAYADVLVPYTSNGSGLLSRSGAFERPGTYAVEVVVPGYSTWTAVGIRVDKLVCHVNTQALVARLRPSP